MLYNTFSPISTKKVREKFVNQNKCRNFALAIEKHRYATIEKQYLVP